MKSPLLILAVSFALGVLAAHEFGPGFHAIPLLVAAASACLLLGLVYLRRERILVSACMALAGFIVTRIAAGVTFQYRFLPNDVHNLAVWGVNLTRNVETEGVIASSPIRGHNSYRFDLECRRIASDGKWRSVRGKVEVRLYTPANDQSWSAAEKLDLRYGDMIRAPMRFQSPWVYRNPGSFNFRWWLEAVNDISWEGEIRSPLLVRKLSASQVSCFSMVVENARTRLLHGIDSLYPPWSSQGRVGAVLKAVLLGDRSSLDSNTVENFRQSGLYHLLVISGLHVGLLASVLLFFLYLLRVGESWRSGCLMVFLGTYSLLVEQRAPTLRASLMIATYLLARYLYRDRSALNAVGLAALILLFHRPAWLFEAGFALSFSAALLIAGLAIPVLQRTTIPYRNALLHLKDPERDINLSPPYAQFRVAMRMAIGELKTKFPGLDRYPVLCERAVTVPFRIGLWVADLVLFSAIIQTGLLMPMAETFHRITIIGIGLNTLAFPLMTVLIALAVPTVVLAATFPVVAVLPAKLLFWLTSALLALTEFRSEPLWMSYRVPGPPLWVAVGFAAALVAVAVALDRSKRVVVVSGCLFITFAAMVVSYPFAPKIPKGMLEVTALDCGRGQAIFSVLPDGTTLLVDAGGQEHFGPDIGRWNPGEEIVSPYLWSRGIKKIDIAVLDGGGDENSNAMAAILRNFKVRELWLSPMTNDRDDLALMHAAREGNVLVRDLSAGDGERLAQAGIQVLWPSSVSHDPQLPPSDKSLVLRIADHQSSILLRGDTDVRVEKQLMQSGMNLSSDVLEAARPLPEVTSQKKFLELVNPRIVLEAGRSVEIPQKRLFIHAYNPGAEDIPVFATATDGAVTIDLKGSALTVLCYGSSKIFKWTGASSPALSSSGL